MDNLERRFGRYAIPRLTLVLLAVNAAGHALSVFGMNTLMQSYFTLNPHLILRGQIWRLVTWLMIPSRDLLSFLIISAFFYFPIGRQMEQVWGDFRYNLYIFLGLLFTVLGAFFVYGFFMLSFPAEVAVPMMRGYAVSFTPHYVMWSIFFAFAATFPDSMVLFMFIVPIKMKWMGIAYGVYLLYLVYSGGIVERVVIIASILNFAVFYLWAQRGALRRYRPSEVRRRQEFRENINVMSPRFRDTVHRCASCGASSTDFPDFEFRYCSKCNGLYEYCQEHLFTHEHVR